MTNTEKKDTLSMPALFGIFIAFLLLGILMCAWPTLTMRDMLEAISNRADLITFDKGAYFTYSAGVCFL